MKLIIGGAFQGKAGIAQEQYPDLTFCDGGTCSLEQLLQARGVVHFQRFLWRYLEENQGDEENLARELIEKNPELVIVSEEVGYGLVPADAFERRYREYTGRICTELAAYAERVDRVVCGVAVRIK